MKFSAYQIGNDKASILSSENVQKDHSRPRLRVFEKKVPPKSVTTWWAHILMKSKNVYAHQLEIILGTEIFEKGHF